MFENTKKGAGFLFLILFWDIVAPAWGWGLPLLQSSYGQIMLLSQLFPQEGLGESISQAGGCPVQHATGLLARGVFTDKVQPRIVFCLQGAEK